MSGHVYDGRPNSVCLWLEDGGKLSGLEWYCPSGGCKDFRDRHCPHVIMQKEGNKALVCGDTERCRKAMNSWAVQQFHEFAKLFEERK